MNKDTPIQNAIKTLRARNLSYGKIGKMIGISGAHVWNVEHGKCDSVKARHYFGLPPKEVKTIPCIVCGDVHKQNHPNPKDKNRFRVALEFETQEDQQRAIEIINNAPGLNRKSKSRYVMQALASYMEAIEYDYQQK